MPNWAWSWLDAIAVMGKGEWVGWGRLFSLHSSQRLSSQGNCSGAERGHEDAVVLTVAFSQYPSMSDCSLFNFWKWSRMCESGNGARAANEHKLCPRTRSSSPSAAGTNGVVSNKQQSESGSSRCFVGNGPMKAAEEGEKDDVLFPFEITWTSAPQLVWKPVELHQHLRSPWAPPAEEPSCHSWEEFNKIRKSSWKDVKGTPHWSIFLIYHHINSPVELANSCSTCQIALAVN